MAQDIKRKFFRFNLTLMGIMLHIITTLTNLRCWHGNFLLCMCRRIEKWETCQDISWILLKFGAGGYFWILSPKSAIKLFYTTSFWRQNGVKVKYPYMAYRKCILRRYDITFCAIFLKTSICLLLMTDYQHTKFRLIWIKKNKLWRGGGIRPPPRLRMY